MKLLFDQNLSPRLVERLSDVYAGSVHVSSAGLAQATDHEVWEDARNGGFIIVSKDTDFSEMSVVRGYPPKVVWIGRGNCSTGEVEEMLRRERQLIAQLADNPALGILLSY